MQGYGPLEVENGEEEGDEERAAPKSASPVWKRTHAAARWGRKTCGECCKCGGDMVQCTAGLVFRILCLYIILPAVVLALLIIVFVLVVAPRIGLQTSEVSALIHDSFFGPPSAAPTSVGSVESRWWRRRHVSSRPDTMWPLTALDYPPTVVGWLEFGGDTGGTLAVNLSWSPDLTLDV